MMLVHQAKNWAVMTYEDASGVFVTKKMVNNVWGDSVKTGSEEQATIEHMATISTLDTDDGPVAAYVF